MQQSRDQACQSCCCTLRYRAQRGRLFVAQPPLQASRVIVDDRLAEALATLEDPGGFLHPELQSVLDSSTSAELPAIPVGGKAQANIDASAAYAAWAQMCTQKETKEERKTAQARNLARLPTQNPRTLEVAMSSFASRVKPLIFWMLPLLSR